MASSHFGPAARLIWLVLVASSCLTRDPEACDQSHPDCPILQHCDFGRFKCVNDVRDDLAPPIDSGADSDLSPG